MSTILHIADAVAEELSVRAFSQPVTAVRHYLPQFELAQMHALHVSVVPHSITSKGLDRTRDQFEYQIDVAVQQKVGKQATAIDPLMTLVEEIADHLRTATLGGYPAARCVEVVNDPVYSREHLGELHQFTSLLRVTYRVVR